MIEKAIYSRLSGASAVTAYVGSRIYHFERPQVSLLPAIIFSRVSTSRDDVAQDGPMGAAVAIEQVSIYSETALEALNIGEEVRKLFHSWKGTTGGVLVYHSKVINENHFLETEDNLKSVVLDLELKFRESTI